MTDFNKQFLQSLESYDYGTRLYDKFREFCKVATYSLAAPFHTAEAKEALKNVNLIDNKPKCDAFEKCLNILVEALEYKHQDFLGQFFMMNNLGNGQSGQFFTPYSLSYMTAKVALNNVKEVLKEKGIIKVSEPTCGSGGMIIALREILIEENLNPSFDAMSYMTDIDELCFFMSYIQISLYGMPARIVHGDTLRMKEYKVLFTPVYFLNEIKFKLLLSDLKQTVKSVEGCTIKPEIIKQLPMNQPQFAEQLFLF